MEKLGDYIVYLSLQNCVFFYCKTHLILKNSSDLNYNDYFTHPLYDGMVSEYIMVNYLVELSPRLRDTYELVNQLKFAIRNHRFEMFYNVLQTSKTRTYPRKLRTVLRTLEKYNEPIKNSFYYTLSNGPVEGINNKIKNIKRSGYGYRNFMNLRYRALISLKLKNKENESKEIYYHELMAS